MRSPESFDAFYAETRDCLLHEAYALTGDLHASRLAVRDAFTVAWHHWRKVSQLDDRDGFVRPVAHRSAQRRHAARPWHRDKDVDDGVRATLGALSKLSAHERKTVVLSTISRMSLTDIAREVGVPRADAERALQSGTSRFAMARDVASTDVRPLLEALLGSVADTRWPRSTIVRRSGTTRRRTHTLLGSAGVVAALLISGTVVASGGVEPSTLVQESALPSVTLREPAPVEPSPLEAESLLTADQVERFGPSLEWQENATTDNLAGDGLAMPCQQTRFADPAGAGALMRSFTGSTEVKQTREVKGNDKSPTKTSTKTRTKTRTVTRKRATAIEFVEMSANPRAARVAFATAQGWYADCLDSRTQLISTEKVSRVGDQAAVLTLRSWEKAPAQIAVGLARTGRLTVITLVRSTARPVSANAAAAGLAAAVNAACGKTGAGLCAGPPKVRPTAPIAVGKPAGLLSPVDMPPVAGAVGPWIGTDPERVRVNYAATRCDNTQFTGKGLKHTLTRTFVFPDMKEVDYFGLTQTVATMRQTQAVGLVDEVRSRIRGCAEANLGTTVDTLVDRSTKNQDLTVWELGFEISDSKTLQFWMAIMRDGSAVSQIGFTPAAGMTMRRDDFTAVAERALERVSDLPSA